MEQYLKTKQRIIAILEHTDLVEYLAPSSIVRTLEAFRISWDMACIDLTSKRGKYLMSISRELFGSNKQLNDMVAGGCEALFIGKDLYDIQAYMWNPSIVLDSPLFVSMYIFKSILIEDGDRNHLYVEPSHLDNERTRLVYRSLDLDWHTGVCEFRRSQTRMCTCLDWILEYPTWREADVNQSGTIRISNVSSTRSVQRNISQPVLSVIQSYYATIEEYESSFYDIEIESGALLPQMECEYHESETYISTSIVSPNVKIKYNKMRKESEDFTMRYLQGRLHNLIPYNRLGYSIINYISTTPYTNFKDIDSSIQQEEFINLDYPTVLNRGIYTTKTRGGVDTTAGRRFLYNGISMFHF
jgi:hypothetical protein